MELYNSSSDYLFNLQATSSSDAKRMWRQSIKDKWNHIALSYDGGSNVEVYVNGEKIASLGFRVKNNATYHGLSINVNNDLTPFSYINPCGIKDQKVTSLKALGKNVSLEEVGERLVELELVKGIEPSTR
mgnify:CR=1 FL=1